MNPSVRTGNRYLTSILVEAGAITEEQVERGLIRQRETGRRIGEALVELGFVTEEDIGWALALQLDYIFLEVSPDALDPPLVRRFPEALLRRVQAIPLVMTDAGLSLAVADPTDAEAVAELQRVAGGPLVINVSTATAIHRALDSVFGRRHEPHGHERLSGPRGAGQFDVLWDRSGVTFLLFHVTTAVKVGASEVHFVPTGAEMRVRYRRGADLSTEATEPIEVQDYLLARIEALGGPTLADGQMHAQGRATCPLAGGQDARLTISLLRSAEGVAVVLRPWPQSGRVPPLGQLGLRDTDQPRLRHVLEHPAGLVVVAGPPRSGRSTTLASLVSALPTADRRVLAFTPRSAPVVPAATYVDMDEKAARGDWEGIVTAQDADVVLIDDLLLGEHLEAVLSPAAAHRFLLASTDWTETFGLLERLLAMPQGRAQLARRPMAILQQRRVVRDSAPKEGEGASPPSSEALFETLVMSDAMRAAVRAGADVRKLMIMSSQDGFLSLAEQVRQRQQAKLLTAAEAAGLLA